MTEQTQESASRKAASRRIVIDPVTRVEGHGKVTIELDNEGNVRQARLHIVEFRGFERFIQGRLLWEVPVIVQRLCGICPVSHHLAAAKAMDWIVGGENLTPTAEKLRRLMHYGQILQSHATHFFHLASPDLLIGLDGDPARRNIAGVLAENPELGRRGIILRKYGQETIAKVNGKRIHGTGAVPGGVNKNLTPPERDSLLNGIDTVVDWSRQSVSFIRDYILQHTEHVRTLGTFPANRMCILRHNGGLELYDGDLKAIDAKGEVIFDKVPPSRYLEYIAEDVRPWSYMKFPFFKKLGPDHGWYRVGPLARITTCRFISTPLAEEARREFLDLLGEQGITMSLAYHWARLVEMLYAAERIRELLHDPDLQRTDLRTRGERREETIAAIEAPRGTLFHHYRIDRNDQVTMANLIVSTTQNNEPMNRAVLAVARNHLNGAEVTEGLLNRIEAVIRAYDPCLSCATHAIGCMPLIAAVYDSSGHLLHSRRRPRH